MSIVVLCQGGDQEPYVEILSQYSDNTQRKTFAHLIGMNGLKLEVGKRYQIEGIIVDQGRVIYDAYRIYVESWMALK